MIYITPNENRSEVPSILERLKLPFEYRTLPVGDYAVGEFDQSGLFDGVPVERKEAGDYINSKENGNLDNHLYELSFNFSFSYLAIIGDLRSEIAERKLSWNGFLSSLVGSSFKRAGDGKQGVVVTIQLGDDWDFSAVLGFLNDKWTKGEQRVPILVKKAWSLDDYAVSILCSFPNIGKVTATNLLNHFGSLHSVFTSSVYELIEAEGIGRKKADDIYRILHLQWKPVQSP